MPRYFFDIHDGELSIDHEGRECADFDAARVLALATVPEVARWAAPEGSDRQAFTMLVRDGAGQLIYRLTLTLDGQSLCSLAA